MSLKALALTLTRPRQIGMALILAVLVLGVLVWLPNLGLLAGVTLGTHLSLAERIRFVSTAYGSLFINYSGPGALILVVFSVLSGINGALVMVVVSGSFRQAASSGATNLWAISAAGVGAGCAACGTSFLAPLVGGIVGTASVGLTEMLGGIVDVIGMSLLVYSIYRLGIALAGLPGSRKRTSLS